MARQQRIKKQTAFSTKRRKRAWSQWARQNNIPNPHKTFVLGPPTKLSPYVLFQFVSMEVIELQLIKTDGVRIPVDKEWGGQSIQSVIETWRGYRTTPEMYIRGLHVAKSLCRAKNAAFQLEQGIAFDPKMIRGLEPQDRKLVINSVVLREINCIPNHEDMRTLCPTNQKP